jgi:UDP-N-acetylmuramate dehydrogenase
MEPPLPLRHLVSLRPFNTFGIDAAAATYLHVTDFVMLEQARCDPQLSRMPRLVLGGGSNLLLTGDFPGLVLHMGLAGIAIVGRDATRVQVRAAAGESWHALVQWTLAQGLGGLENLSLIPGSVGACPIQNIGAYGVEAGNLIDAVRYLDWETGEIVTLDRAACAFGYRDSIFKHGLRDRAVILDVTFGLPVHWQPNLRYAELAQELAGPVSGQQNLTAPIDILNRMQNDVQKTASDAPETPLPISLQNLSPAPQRQPDAGFVPPDAATISRAVIAIRTRKLPDPARIGNAGSFFKNPVVSAVQRDALLAAWPAMVSFVQQDGSYKLAAGWLIDACGWKGRSLGAAGVYEKQALVLVNRGNASGADILQLAQAIQADVQTRFGVLLEAEPVIV